MIKLLIRLYPARWRDRYGDEFEVVLRDRPLAPFDIADLLLGALDAHLHLRGLGAASQHGRGFAMTLRIGGYAAVLGGLLWFTALAGNAINDGDETNSWWLGIVLVVATIVTLIALIGLSAFQARRYPALTWAAVAIPAAGGIVALLGIVAITITGDSDRRVVGDMAGGRSPRWACLRCCLDRGCSLWPHGGPEVCRGSLPGCSRLVRSSSFLD